MKGELTKEQALGRAASLCSGSEYCSTQIREKLSSWGISDDDADSIIERLTSEHFIDDSRFCRAYAHDKFCYNHWGKVKIGQMLRHMRLDPNEIAEGLAEIPDEAYQESLQEALRQKDRTLRDTDTYQRKAKLVRHLLSRGFEMSLVLDAVDDFLSL